MNVFWIVLGLVAVMAPFVSRLYVNTTDSAPVGIYWVSGERYERGDLVVSCLPADASSALAVQRLYLNSSLVCESRVEPVLKTVTAEFGDEVCVSSAGVTVNGEMVSGSRPLAEDRAGRSMPVLNDSGYIAPGQVWLMSPGIPHAFDARYFGPTPASLVIGKAKLVWSL